MRMKMRGLLLIMLFVLPLVTSYQPCSEFFIRHVASSPGNLIAGLEVNFDRTEVDNYTDWRVDITFTQRVNLTWLNVSSVLQTAQWSPLFYLYDPLEMNTETADNLTYVLTMTIDKEEFTSVWSNIRFTLFFNISYSASHVDVSHVNVNNEAICSDRNKCGETHSSKFLINYGQSVVPGEFPWLAALHNKTETALSFICGGTLVSRKHVITAAHCIKKEDSTFYDLDTMTVVLGIHKLLDFRSLNWQSFDLIDFVVHYDWGLRRNDRSDADIAVLVLTESVKFSVYIKPACLNFDDQVGTRGTVIGWGLREDGSYQSEPLSVNVPIVSTEMCRNSDSTFNDITSERTFCAGHRNGSGPCSGDSGSGFYTLQTLPGDKPRYSLTGIVSRSLYWGHQQQCNLRQYVIYTRFSSFKDWVELILGAKPKKDVNYKFVEDLLREMSGLRAQNRNYKEQNKLQIIKDTERADVHQKLEERITECENLKVNLETQLAKLVQNQTHLLSIQSHLEAERAGAMQNKTSSTPQPGDTKMKNETLETELDIEKRKANELTVEKFRQKYNLTGRDIGSVMEKACIVDDVTVVSALLDLGVDIAVKRTGGATCLYRAAEKNNVNVARLVLDRGADIDLRESNQYTPLMTAANDGRLDVIKLLVSRGVNLTLRNGLNQTALKLARNNRRTPTVNYLVSINAPE